MPGPARACLFAVLGLAACVACADPGIDPTKFVSVDAAGQARRIDAQASDAGSTRVPERLKDFEAAIAAADARMSGRREKAALKDYADAAEAYRYFLRFQKLENDVVGGMVLLRGASRPIAIRYALPFEERGGGRWVDRQKAMDTFASKAAGHLAEAARLVRGETIP